RGVITFRLLSSQPLHTASVAVAQALIYCLPLQGTPAPVHPLRVAVSAWRPAATDNRASLSEVNAMPATIHT
ncbi:hypothetical protein, partial [Cronobacter condimenti]|uniref:hypothetical protein n=1 Tax=Cronobacter condimenti TaxID=1163710 RepID=UPI00196B5BA2